MAYASWSVVANEQPSTAKWNILGTNAASFNDGSGIANLTLGAVTAVSLSYKFLVYRNVTVNSSTSLTKVSFDAKVYDTGSNVDVVTNIGRFTAPIAGFYHFDALITLNQAANSVQSTVLYKNGLTYLAGVATANNGTIQNIGSGVSTTLQLAASDYIEIFFSSSYAPGATFVFGTSPLSTWFSGYLVSKT